MRPFPFPFGQKISRAGLALLALCALATSLQAQPKIALVDLKKVFDGYYKTKQADTLLQSSGADADKILGGMLEEYKKNQQEYNKLTESANDQAVSSDEREKRRKTAEKKVVELKENEQSITQYRREAEARIMEQKARMRDNILKEIQDVINGKAKAGNYTMVLDSSAEARFATAIVLYTNGQNDLTDEVLSQLNKDAPPPSLTSETKDNKASVAPPKALEKEVKPTVAPAKPPKKK